MMNLTESDIMLAAARLLSEAPANGEVSPLNREEQAEQQGYDRALAELTAALMGLDDDNTDVMPFVLRSIRAALDA